MSRNVSVGMVGIGVYLPKTIMTAKEIAERTNGLWTEDAIISKLGIKHIYLPDDGDTTNTMAVKSVENVMKETGVKATEIDVIIYIGQEMGEQYTISSGSYSFVKTTIGAVNAWGFDMQNVCSSFAYALRVAKSIMVAHHDVKTILITGAFITPDFIKYERSKSSLFFMFSSGGASVILKKNLGKNLLLGTGMTDLILPSGVSSNSLAREVAEGKSLDMGLLYKTKLKGCIKNGLGNLDFKDIDVFITSHIKPSLHSTLLNLADIEEKKALQQDGGHFGSIDHLILLDIGLKSGRIKDGSVCVLFGSGVAYGATSLAATTIKWGTVGDA